MRQLRIGLALIGKDFGIKRGLRREMLEQQPLGDGGGRRDALGRRPRETVTCKATLRRAQDELTPQVAGHAQGRHEACEYLLTSRMSRIRYRIVKRRDSIRRVRFSS